MCTYQRCAVLHFATATHRWLQATPAYVMRQAEVCVVAGRGSGQAGTSGSTPPREHVDEIYSLVFDDPNVHQQVTM